LAVGKFQIGEQSNAQRATRDCWAWLAGEPLGTPPVKKEYSEVTNSVEEDRKPTQVGHGGKLYKHLFFSFALL
jgi:hypothetical protein